MHPDPKHRIDLNSYMNAPSANREAFHVWSFAQNTQHPDNKSTFAKLVAIPLGYKHSSSDSLGFSPNPVPFDEFQNI